MTAYEQLKQSTADPLGLSDLEAIEPAYDGWEQIESALTSHQKKRRNWQRTGSWLAVAASLLLVISVTLQINKNQAVIESSSPALATLAEEPASLTIQDNVNALISLSQKVEGQVKKLRQETSSMPAESAIYVAELEDLIARVDNELSLRPDSIDLWGQRVNLMLDLTRIYQQQWQIDYGRMASL